MKHGKKYLEAAKQYDKFNLYEKDRQNGDDDDGTDDCAALLVFLVPGHRHPSF